MQGKIDADITAMPVANSVAVFVGAAALLIIVTVIIFIFVRKLGFTNFGPLKVEHRGLSTEYRMNEATDAEDDLCKKQMRQITDKMKRGISNIFAELNVCTIAKVAVATVIRNPFFESIANNHFTTELMPEYYKSYRMRIIDTLQDEYISLSSVSHDIQCNKEALPPWDQVSKSLIWCVDTWLRRVSKEVMITCEKKIAIYKSYLNDFVEAKDEYRIGIVKQCIEKNERYINVLKDRIGRDNEKEVA
jgi:hypothetical protein